MVTFPTIGVLPTDTVAIESPIVVIGTPALVALGFALVLVVGIVCAARLLRRMRGRAPKARVRVGFALPYTAPKRGT